MKVLLKKEASVLYGPRIPSSLSSDDIRDIILIHPGICSISIIGNSYSNWIESW